eukprot:6221027-Pyramimonas_sp.AAC.1
MFALLVGPPVMAHRALSRHAKHGPVPTRQRPELFLASRPAMRSDMLCPPARRRVPLGPLQ